MRRLCLQLQLPGIYNSATSAFRQAGTLLAPPAAEEDKPLSLNRISACAPRRCETCAVQGLRLVRLLSS